MNSPPRPSSASIATRSKGSFPNPHVHQFADLAVKLAGQGDAAYLFNGALARHLKDAEGWNDKVSALLEILRTAPDADAAPCPGAVVHRRHHGGNSQRPHGAA